MKTKESQKMPECHRYKTDKRFRRCLDLTLQISLWVLLISLIFVQSKITLFIKIILIGVYIFYVINAFYCQEWTFINKIIKSMTFQEKLRLIFRTPPKLNFIGNSDKIGKNRPKQEKNKPSVEVEEFKYYTGRDISGSCNLDINLILNKGEKKFIQMKLHIDFELEDSMTKLDYYTQKDNFINWMNKIDPNFKFTEEVVIPGFEDCLMINLQETEPFWLNKFIYILFTIILPVIEIYKYFMNDLATHEEFTIRKIFSSRNDLTNLNADRIYKDKNPSLIMKGTLYGVQDFYYVKRKFYDDPSETDLNKALYSIKMLKNKLSKYLTNTIKSVEYCSKDKISDNPLKEELIKKGEKSNTLIIHSFDIEEISTKGHSAPDDRDLLLIKV